MNIQWNTINTSYVYIVSKLCTHQNSIIRLVSANLLLLRNSMENRRQAISSDRIYEIKLPTLHSVPDNMRMRYYSLLVVNSSTHCMCSREEKKLTDCTWACVVWVSMPFSELLEIFNFPLIYFFSFETKMIHIEHNISQSCISQVPR